MFFSPEVGRQWKSGLLKMDVLVVGRDHLLDQVLRSAVQPDDRIVERFAYMLVIVSFHIIISVSLKPTRSLKRNKFTLYCIVIALGQHKVNSVPFSKHKN